MTQNKPSQHIGTPLIMRRKLIQEFLRAQWSKSAMLICLLWVILSLHVSHAADVPCGFVDELIDNSLTVPLGIVFLPDGNALAWEQSGKIVIFNPNGNPVSPANYMTVPHVINDNEAGLMDITLDPNFTMDPNPVPPANSYFYVYYVHDSNNHGRISRFNHLVESNTGDPNTEFVVFEDSDVDRNPSLHGTRHVGAGLDFAPDGTLFLTTGDRDVPDEGTRGSSQDLTVHAGKILRLNKDGSIPEDNPFLEDPNVLPEIYAYGLRNPFRARFDDATGRFFIADVGGNSHTQAVEEINLGKKGVNYGWPLCEGVCPDQAIEPPLFLYNHGGNKASLTGGVIYRGSTFPSEFHGAYFYGDFVRGWLRYLTFDAIGNVATDHEFSPDIGPLLAVEQGPDGHLYYMKLGFEQPSEIRRIRYRIEPEPKVKIISPLNDATYAQDRVTALEGIGCDLEDGNLTESLVWESDVDGTLGNGSSLVPSNLSVGVHRITATVTDSGGLIGSKQVTMTVTEPIGTEIMEIQVGAPSDDAEESSPEIVVLGSGDIELGFNKELEGNQTVGLRFNSVDLPEHAIVVDAYVQFQADERNSEPTSLTITGEASDNATTFNSSSNNIGSRPKTLESVTWMPDPWSLVGEADVAQRTPNLAAVIQEIKDRPGWLSNNAIVLIIGGTGRRTAVAYDQNQAGAPILKIEYDVPNQPPAVTISAPANGATFLVGDSIAFSAIGTDPEDEDTTLDLEWESDLDGSFGGGSSYSKTDLSPGIHTVTVTVVDGEGLTGSSRNTIIVAKPGQPLVTEVRVNKSSDDAEERISNVVTLGSGDLEMLYTTEGVRGLQVVGIRFESINVPQGAVVENAYIQFTADVGSSRPASFTIHGESNDNATTFTDTPSNITSRPLTAASVSWSPDRWTKDGEASIAEQTPNLTKIMQEIVDRPGWSSGNASAFIINGSGDRIVKAYNRDPNAAPLLHLEYKVTDLPPVTAITTPKDKAVFSKDDVITFTATATASGGSDLTPTILWKEASIDRAIGEGSSVSISDLSVGDHTITASVTDSSGLTGLAQITVSVVPSGPN